VQNKDMMRNFPSIVVLLSIFLWTALPLTAQNTGGMNTSQIITAIEPSLVNVTFLDDNDEVVGYSTGFFVSNNAVVTSLKFFNQSAKATITDYNNKVFPVLSRLNDLPEYDLALVKVNYTKGKPIEISPDTETSGSTVFAISTLPGAGFTFNFASGKLLSANRTIDNIAIVEAETNTRVSATAAVLINASAELIGIINANITAPLLGKINGNLPALQPNYLNTLLRKGISDTADEPKSEPELVQEDEEEPLPTPSKSADKGKEGEKTVTTYDDEPEDEAETTPEPKRKPTPPPANEEEEEEYKPKPKPAPTKTTPEKPAKKPKITVVPPDDRAKKQNKSQQPDRAENKPTKEDLRQSMTSGSSSVAYKGPSTALYSLAVPGLGNYKMSNKKPYYWAITAAAYGMVGYGIFSKIQSNNQYQNYKTATTPSEINSMYQKANKNHLLGSYIPLSAPYFVSLGN